VITSYTATRSPEGITETHWKSNRQWCLTVTSNQWVPSIALRLRLQCNGYSVASAASTSVTPAAIPDARVVSVTAGNTQPQFHLQLHQMMEVQ
jgi:hypothetical protein